MQIKCKFRDFHLQNKQKGFKVHLALSVNVVNAIDCLGLDFNFVFATKKERPEMKINVFLHIGCFQLSITRWRQSLLSLN